ncbi:MAG TPA: methyltransferase domain-containing protein [Candidatus Dormibacteraeota bacterium]|nr:methyltransferase domain-containing protein [Candidatus Dormibacteraeota bacterium]
MRAGERERPEDGALKRLARARFGRQAARYLSSPTHARGEELARMIELARPLGGERLLDVATGAGHTALAFVPWVGEVIALDLAPAMLRTAGRHLRSQGAVRVDLLAGDAEAMPLAASSLDLVTCRYAAHHFPRPERFLAEVARVLRPGGRLVVFDNMVPEDDRVDAFVNRLEGWRDPSHVRSRRPSEWRSLLERAGLELEAMDPLVRRTYDFSDWTARQAMPAADRARLERWLMAAPRDCAEQVQLQVADGQVRSLAVTFGTFAARRP